jgi:hypothetical protein
MGVAARLAHARAAHVTRSPSRTRSPQQRQNPQPYRLCLKRSQRSHFLPIPNQPRRILPKFDPLAVARKMQEAMAAAAGAGPGSSANSAPSATPVPAMSKFGGMSMGLGRGMGLNAASREQATANAAAAAAVEAAALHMVETLPSLQFQHKYTRPVDCSVTMQRLGIGPVECMVEVTLRRNGPAHLLALTGPSGRVRWATEVARM